MKSFASRMETPPDFACGSVAFEVRRLNQHDASGNGLELSAAPLVMKFSNLLGLTGSTSNRKLVRHVSVSSAN